MTNTRLFVQRLNDAGLPDGEPVEIYGISRLSISRGEAEVEIEDGMVVTYSRDITLSMFDVSQEAVDVMVGNLERE